MNPFSLKRTFNYTEAACAFLGITAVGIHRSEVLTVERALKKRWPPIPRTVYVGMDYETTQRSYHTVYDSPDIPREELEAFLLEDGRKPEDFPLLFPPKPKAPEPGDCGMSKEALLRVIGGLCITLVEKNDRKYRKAGGGLNSLALQTDIQNALVSVGLNATGTGKSQITELLKNDIVQDVLNALNK